MSWQTIWAAIDIDNGDAMQVFITGASGFVGGAIARRLLHEHEVHCMARSSSSASIIEALGASPVSCDLDSLNAGHLSGCEAVVHAAAYVAAWGPKKDFWRVNVAGTTRMLTAAREAGVRRFVHIGTEAALFYGQPMINIDETYPYPEYSPFFYSETKREAERAVLAANIPGEFECISVRPRLVWGPGDETILANLVEMIDSGSFRWLDGGRYKTSTTHVENVVEGVELALAKGKGGEAYFITDSEISTIKEFLTALLATAGRKAKDRNAPSWLARLVAFTFESVYKTLGVRSTPPITRLAVNMMAYPVTINIEKARRELGYTPAISLKQGMADLAVVGKQ